MMPALAGHATETLAADLRALGLSAGSIVLVHCSLRRVGPIAGGPSGLLAALTEVVGPAGTLVVPAQTPDNSITSAAYRTATAEMTDDQRRAHEKRIPGFHPKHTPSYGVGAFAEYVRRQPDAVRSRHPQTSFCAVGPAAADLMRVHHLRSHLGEQSPLAALEAAGARTLLLGVGYESCTALHLAEYRLNRPPVMQRYRCYVQHGSGGRKRWEFRAPLLDATRFTEIGSELDRTGSARRGRVGDAEARLLPIRPAVQLAVEWMNHNPTG
jgi:aminoglycoside 3-N-acetyltransferase